MDTISKVLNLVKQGDWAISLDLKDAYFHIKVFKNHRKYLRFSVQGQVYQFKALCFGPTSSPRVFTKVVSVVAAHLRKQNIRLAVYLDDWMCVNQFQQKLVIDREIMLNLLVRLGFLINHEKSSLIPNQTITYLGAVFKFDQGLVLPTQDRIQSLFFISTKSNEWHGNSQTLHGSIGENGILSRVDSECQVIYEACPITFTSKLDPIKNEFRFFKFNVLQT
ncbi:Hypothetical predicted protein [Mytilus galloprovincialis]|uniref:Reverse transcriptase domain-containing protein n=1 Tax=Mytilus galloprovincialis TaxID=29158 RepID=A0A8B6FEC6_MYTGA|nr:Hypothetical predicted protein [Mytilus galloprovincialis]